MLAKNKLKGKIVEKDLTAERVSAELGINPATFNRKINGISDFTRCEIQLLRNLLSLTENDIMTIFFADELANTQVAAS